MLYIYIGLGAFVLILIFIISNAYLKREKRYKIKLNHFLQHQEYTPAIDMAKRLVQLRQKKPEYHYMLADIYIKAKMVPSAISTYEKMIQSKIFSTKIKEHNIREKIALVNLDQGKIIEAYRELYVIAKLNPASYTAFGLLGRIYGSQRKYDKAKDYLKKAIKLNIDIAEFHYQLGLAFLDTGDLGLAIEELDKAYQLDNEHLKAQYFLALGCRQKGLKEKAAMLFQKLNIENIEDLPQNITNIGIMTQNIPLFEIDQMEHKLNEELGDITVKSTESTKIDSIEALLNAGTEIFHNKAISIIAKMGYVIVKEVKNRLIDNSTEVDFIAVNKSEKDKQDAKQYFIQFTKATGEIGTIPYADFLSKMHEAKVNSGIFIITAEFSEQIYKRSEQEKESISLVDANKLKRFL